MIYKEAGENTVLLPLFALPHFVPKLVSVIIINKNYGAIKQFVYEINQHNQLTENNDRNRAVQNCAQLYYVESCFAYENSLPRQEKSSLFQYADTDRPVPVILIKSNDSRYFELFDNTRIVIPIYQIRSKDKSRAENIYVEPFYPNYKLMLTDIYSLVADNIKCKAFYKQRVAYDARRKFIKRWNEVFNHNPPNIDSFETFQAVIHHLSPQHLYCLFRADITFV